MLKICALIIICSISVLAQLNTEDLTVEHISLKDGLSQSTISSIYQDSEGFIWFGTANGLDRYDGYGFKVYKTDFLDTASISDNIINGIFEDRSGIIWISTENGVNSFDRSTGKFRRYLSGTVEKRIMPVLEDEKGNIWLGSYGNGLLRLNKKDGSISKYPNDPVEKDNSKDYIWTAVMDPSGNLLLGTLHGLISFDLTREKFREFNFLTSGPEGTSGLRIHAILNDDNFFWIGSESGMLDLFDPSTGTFRHYSIEYKGDKDNSQVSAIIPYDQDRLLIALMGSGIKIFNKKTLKVEGVVNNLTDNRIYSLMVDNFGIIWGGTYASGINKINPFARKFRAHSSRSFINSFFKDDDNVLWIGTADGLNKYNPGRDTYTVSKLNKDNENSRINSITGWGKDIWVGTPSGIYRFNKSTEKFTSFNGKAGINGPVSLIQKYEKYLLICTRGSGVKLFDPASGRIIPDDRFGLTELSNLNISSAAIDNSNIIWLGSDKGITGIEPDGNIKRNRLQPGKKNTLSSDYILSLYSGPDGILWIGTYGGGLNRLDKNGNITWFSEKQGLPDNVVYGIVADSGGSLWLSTNRGLCMFNPSDFSVKSYDVSDGLQGLEFNWGAAYKSADGEIYFGGLDGWNSFYPGQIKENKVPPIPAITAISIFNQQIDFTRDKTLLLSYNQNFISFDFVALHFEQPGKNKYAYMLKGFDREWNYCGIRRFAYYTNLSPGEYTFIVKGCNSDGIWSENTASVSFIITPPFWTTWWFYLLSLTALTILIVSIHKYRMRVKLREMQRIEDIRKGIADDFHDELGHKLTKISLYSEIMRRELSGVLNGNEEYLKKIYDAANNLYDDTKDFIWSIDPVKDTLFDLAVYLKDFGDEFFDKTEISFIVKEIPEEYKKYQLPMSWKRQLTLIFKEAMNNILKHSGSSQAAMYIEADKGQISIKLIDNGRGFNEKDIHKAGRGLDIMKSRAAKIGGLLEISPGEKGTQMTFTGELPLSTKRDLV